MLVGVIVRYIQISYHFHKWMTFLQSVNLPFIKFFTSTQFVLQKFLNIMYYQTSIRQYYCKWKSDVKCNLCQQLKISNNGNCIQLKGFVNVLRTFIFTNHPLPVSCHWSLSIPPEISRKPGNSCCFQEVCKETRGHLHPLIHIKLKWQ